jgi:hypothetical protein
MAADNNLKEESIYALTEIFRVGPTEQIDVIAQLDSGDVVNRFDFRKLRNARYLDAPVVQNIEGLKETIISDPKILQNITNTKMLADFLDQSIVNQANPIRNMVVLSGHGSGAAGDFLNTENPPSTLSIPRLKSVLVSTREKLGRKIDVLGMDSCLMSMVEVLYEVRDGVNFVVGAEGFERNTGWPYHEIFSVLRTEPAMTPKKLACSIVKEYVHYYSPYYLSGVSVDLAACDLRDGDTIAILIGSINRLAQVLRKSMADSKVEGAILVAHWRAQSYKFELYTDLWDFCDQLQLAMGSYGNSGIDSKWDISRKAIEDACRDVKQAIDKLVLISCYSGAASQHSHGLSIYFPWSKSDLDRDLGLYRNLAFADATKWDEFLEDFVAKTQREERGRSDDPEHKSGKKELLSMPPRDESATSIRDFPQLGSRDFPQLGHRGSIRVPRMKNPPDRFFKYEDDCACDCKE